MAATILTTIQGALGTIVEPKVSSQINRSIVLPQVLKAKTGQNHNVAWSVQVGTAKGTAIADGADVVTYNNDTKVPARLEYGTYHDAFSISGKAISACLAAGNPEQLGNLFMEEMKDSVRRLSYGLAEAMYIGNGTLPEIHGLHDATIPAIGDAGTYATINSATHAQWKSSVEDAAAALVTTQHLRNIRRKIYVASGQKPDAFVTDPVQFERIAGAIESTNRQFTQDAYRNDGSKIVLAGGFNMVKFDGIAVIEDHLHPAQTISVLNSDEADVFTLPQPPTEVSRAMGNQSMGGTAEEQFGETNMGIQCRVQPLSITGDAFKFALYVYPALRVRRRNAHGKVINLAA